MADSGELVFKDRAGQVRGQVLFFAATAKPEEAANALTGSEPILRVEPALAHQEGEAELQLLEGLRYEYECSNDQLRLALFANDSEGVVRPSRLRGRQHSGLLVPGLATGLMQLCLEDAAGQSVAWAGLEVRSRKLNYKADYRQMMENISARCVDLLSDWRAVSQFKAEPDPGQDAQTVAQRFAFVRGLLDAQPFRDALHRISTQPHQSWELEPQQRSVSRGFRADRRTLAQLARGGGRIEVPTSHPLHQRLRTLPQQITQMRATLSEDTAENRFVKFALQGFLSFIDKVAKQVDPLKEPRLWAEIQSMEAQLDLVLQSDVLRHVGPAQVLPLGSPVLQRREGYREVLQAWLKFAMAAKLVWQGGDDVYGAGQRDVATLYEYWVFFCLLDLVADLFKLDKPIGESLLEATQDGFGLKLKAGKFLALQGHALVHERDLRVQLSYNRSFSKSLDRQHAGSWTETLRPDYTLSLWPSEFSAEEAEQQELMVHVHFDAKYRLENVHALLGDSALDDEGAEAKALSDEKKAQAQGHYKRADLLKMHAYRDAIRRSHGAYVLYPGTENQQRQGFHEVLPGLGAFALRPGSGADDLKAFLIEVLAHVCNRASAREQHSFSTYRNYRAEEVSSALYQAMPEREHGEGGQADERHPPPRRTFVLAGWVKSKDHLQWIEKTGLYNFRMDDERGSLALSAEVAGASYLLFHGANELAQSGLYRIKSKHAGPRVYSKEKLKQLGYPSEPSRGSYLVFEVEPAQEFKDVQWDYAALPDKPESAKQGFPFAFSLQQLLMVKRKP